MIFPAPPASTRCVALDLPYARGRFVVAAPLEREVVLVPDVFDATDASRLALSLHADATRAGDKWRIARRMSMLASLRAQDLSWLTAQARDSAGAVEAGVRLRGDSASLGVLETLVRARRDMSGLRASTFDDSAMQAQTLNPAGRLLSRILRNVSLDVLAQALPGAVTVFSNHPVGAELPLAVTPEALSAYSTNFGRFAAWGASARDSARVSKDDLWLLPPAVEDDGDPTVVVRVNRTGRVADFDLAAYNRSGALECHATLNATAFAGPVSASLVPRLGSVTLPADVAAAAQDAVDPPRESLDLEARDPLDRLAREALVVYARAAGYSGVTACVPDDLYTAVRGCVTGDHLDLDAVRRAIETCDCEELSEGGTLLVRPRHPLQEEATRIDRVPLVTEYRAIRSGRFGFEDILGLHVAYAESYGESPFLFDIEESMRRAFDLSSKPGWGLPHEILVALGGLTRPERSQLAGGGELRLSRAQNTAVVVAVSKLLGRQGSSSRSALSLLPQRLAADPRGIVLRGDTAVATVVKRVARYEITVVTRDSVTGERRSVTGPNQLLDSTYVPFDPQRLLRGNSHLASSERYLDDHYRFFWQRQRQTAIEARQGIDLSVGPYVVREPIESSKEAVPLRDVPGAQDILRGAP